MMQTPSLRGRVVLAGAVVGSVVLLGVDLFVWVSLRDRLLDNLAGVLTTRAQLVSEVGVGLTPEELDERLTQLGIPAVIHAPDGDFPAEPIVRSGALPPADPLGGSTASAIERDVVLGDGTTVTVLASRAGVDGTLRRVLVLEVIGSLVAVALLVGLLVRASRRALGPIDEVVATARRIGAGRTGERLRPDRPGTELGRMATAFDEMLDALEEALEESRTAEARMRRFVAQAAHQLRTPVAALRSSVDALMRIDDENEREQLLDHVGSEMVRISRLVRSLLRLAELDEAELSPAGRGPVDLDTLIAEESARADSFDADVTVRVGGTAGQVEGWSDALREAMSNVLDNCVRHARHQVVVNVSAGANRVTIRVSDDGDGLPEGASEAVFERFVSFDDGGGSGLGLPIARAIARAHAGDLAYEDGAFVLTLPR